MVVLTHNHKARLLQTLRALEGLPDGWPIIVVDNGSTDGTAKAVGREFPAVMLIRSRRNIGAAARNIAVAYAHTPYVAFSDDDMRWEPGALEKAVAIMDANPGIAVVSGCIRLADSGRIDPRCLAASHFAAAHHNSSSSRQLALQPDACVLRTRAFYEAGGFWPPMYKDGEEVLLALDIADRGWHMIYTDEVRGWRTSNMSCTQPSQIRRRLRNTIWAAWMRLPVRLAWQETVIQVKEAARCNQLKAVLLSVAGGMGRALQHRRVVSMDVSRMWASRYQYAAAYPDDIQARPSSRSMV